MILYKEDLNLNQVVKKMLTSPIQMMLFAFHQIKKEIKELPVLEFQILTYRIPKQDYDIKLLFLIIILKNLKTFLKRVKQP